MRGKKTAVYHSASSAERLVKRALNKVDRWENPIGTSINDIGELLTQTSTLLQIVFDLISYLPDSKELYNETIRAREDFNQIPDTAIDELDVIKKEELSAQLYNHVNIILQHRFLHGIRQYLWASERVLEQNLLVSEGARINAVQQLRNLYKDTQYSLVQSQSGIDGYAFDEILDTIPVDWVEWKLELRLYEIIKLMRKREWFQVNSLTNWAQTMQAVSDTQINYPRPLISNEIIMGIDIALINQAIFHTDLFIASLIAVLSRNTHLSARSISNVLLKYRTNPNIMEYGWQKVIVGLSTGIESEDPKTFNKILNLLKN